VTAGIMAEEYLNTPLVGKHLRRLGIFPTKKNEPEPGLIRDILRLIQHDRIIMIYPQGGRSWTGKIDTWIPATSKLFRSVGIPIYPVVTHGSYQAWPRWAKFLRPARIEVEIKSPLQFSKSQNLEEVESRLQDQIESNEDKIPIHLRPKWAFKPGLGIERVLYRNTVSGQYGGYSCKDGRRIFDEDGKHVYTVRNDSQLEKQSDQTVSSVSEVLAEIRSINIPSGKGSDILRSEVRYSIHKNGKNKKETGWLSLKPDHLLFESTGSLSIPMSDILFLETSKSTTLRLTLEDQRITVTFLDRTGPLPWYDAINSSRN